MALREIDALDFDVGQAPSNIPANPSSESELLQDQRALKMHGAAKEVFGNIPPMQVQFPPLLQKTPNPRSKPEAVTKAVAGTNIAATWPNPGKEALNLGLEKEKIMVKNLNDISSTIDGIQDKLAQILSLNRKINKLPSDKSPYTITDEMKQDIAALKALGIDLVSEDEKELSAEKLASLKTTLETEKSQLNTAMQIQCTKIQTNTQQYSSLLDSLKVIEKHVSRLLATILDNMKR